MKHSCQRFDDQACKLFPSGSKISQTNRSGWNSPPPPPRTTCQPLFCERNLIGVLGHPLLQIQIHLSRIIYFPNFSFRLLAQTTLRNILGTKNLHEILSDRESISGSMQVRTLHASTSCWQNSIKWKDRLHTVHCPSCTFWATHSEICTQFSNLAPPWLSQLGLKSMNIYKKICLL